MSVIEMRVPAPLARAPVVVLPSGPATVYAPGLAQIQAGDFVTAVLAGYVPTDPILADLVTLVAVSGRPILTANRTYFVSPSGSDANDGLSLAGAFRTVQRALNVCGMIDFNGFAVTIQLAAGTYTEQLVVPVTLGQKTVSQLTIVGDTVTPANVVLTKTLSFDGIVKVGPGARVTLNGMKLLAGDGNTHLLYATNSGYVEYQNVTFSGGFYQVFGDLNGGLKQIGPCSILAGAFAHWALENAGVLQCIGQTVTLTGTPTFSGAFAAAKAGSVMRVDLNTFTGSATGARYDSESNSIIDSRGSGETYLPGDSAGIKATQGLYL